MKPLRRISSFAPDTFGYVIQNTLHYQSIATRRVSEGMDSCLFAFMSGYNRSATIRGPSRIVCPDPPNRAVSYIGKAFSALAPGKNADDIARTSLGQTNAGPRTFMRP